MVFRKDKHFNRKMGKETEDAFHKFKKMQVDYKHDNVQIHW